MQQTHKAVTRRVEAKKLLSRRKQSEYRHHLFTSFNLLEYYKYYEYQPTLHEIWYSSY